MSGRFSIPPGELLARLKSRRGLVGIAVAILALGGGGYYFCNSSPETAAAMMYQKPATDALKTPRLIRKSSPATTHPIETVAPATQPVAVEEADDIIDDTEIDHLGAAYVDVPNGFSVRFPKGWPIQTFAADPWVLDCGDVGNAIISVGLTPCPADVTVDRLLPEAIARRIKKTAGTTLLAQGKSQIGGRKALWFKSTGPLPMTNGAPIMTRVQYIVPLGDGRLMQIRLAAPPASFASLSTVLRQTIDTFTIIPRPGASATAN